MCAMMRVRHNGHRHLIFTAATLLILLCCVITSNMSGGCHAFSTTPITSVLTSKKAAINMPLRVTTTLTTTTALQMSQQTREDEIRRKISELKRDGKLDNKNKSSSSSNSGGGSGGVGINKSKRAASTDYAEKISSKFSNSRKARQVGRILGMDIQSYSTSTEETQGEKDNNQRKAKLGALDMEENDDDDDDNYDDDEDYLQEYQTEVSTALEISDEDAKNAIDMIRRNVDKDEQKQQQQVQQGTQNDNNGGSGMMDEDDMINAVAKLLGEKGDFKRAYTEIMEEMERQEEEEEEEEEKKEQEEKEKASATTISSSSTTTTIVSSPSVPGSPSNTKSTTGVGGAWTPPSTTDETKSQDTYQPKVGTWGAFPRPRNISTAYGGGKRVGAGVKTDESRKQQSINDTKERLRAYREKMGIEVQSEKDYGDQIEEALALASRAMQRGSYSAGVSALEKVTQYCSTKSKLGGKVFLELAMAYEAEGQTDKAIGLYAALTKSPIEQIKMNADKLLYGLEAMNFMRNEAKLKEFSRRNAAETFIDATGFKDISKNFDKVYNTAYIDLDKGSQYYRMLSENVVRSTREARQILLKATDSGEVDRTKIVQALRSISRHFDEALTAEKEQEASKNVPVDYAGRPITGPRRSSMSGSSSNAAARSALSTAIGMDGYVLSDRTQTLESLNGEWRLQLMADRKGEGVDFFNSTLVWQILDTSEKMDYATSSSQTGSLKFKGSERVLKRATATGGGGGGESGGLFSALFSGRSGMANKMTNVPQQVLSVDSALLVTRAVVSVPAADNVKDYFSVWRRAEPGTYRKKK